MSFAQFEEKFWMTPCPAGWREGQHVFNFMYSIRPNVTEILRGTSLDCFHNDKNIKVFLSAAKELW